MLGFSIIQALKISIPGWIPVLLVDVNVFIGIPLIYLIVTRKTYEKTEYRFYKDRLEYCEGF